MRDDVRRAALEAAYKVTISVVALSGCTGNEPRVASVPNESPADTGAIASTAQASVIASTSATSTASCDAIVKAAFPVPSDYPGTKKTVPAQVAACCEKVLLADDFNFTNPNRWDCCANAPSEATVGSACTPWGPPMPPPMPATSIA